MKKAEKYIYLIVIVILVGVIIGGSVYFLNKDNKKPEEETKEPVAVADSVKLINTKEESDKIVQEYEIVINGKKKNVNIAYKLDKNDYGYSIRGKFNNIDVYTDSGYLLDDSNVGIPYTAEDINKKFSSNNFTFIKGKDGKSYFAIKTLCLTGESYGGPGYIIFNEDLESIMDSADIENNTGRDDIFIILDLDMGIGLDNEINPWYKNDAVCSMYYQDSDCGVRAKIENDKIYYLYFNLKCEGAFDDYDPVYERVYTINNNKLEYETINTYKVKHVAGIAC